MHEQPPPRAIPRAIHVQPRADGSLTYLIGLPPEALPPVRARDLAAAWDAARDAAAAEAWGTPRFFRFCRGENGVTDLALADADASCWAAAVDRMFGLGSTLGMSLCLRLLALIDLLASAPWTAPLVELRRDGAEIDPALLLGAATLPLTREARMDETLLRARVAQARLVAPQQAAPPRARHSAAGSQFREPRHDA